MRTLLIVLLLSTSSLSFGQNTPVKILVSNTDSGITRIRIVRFSPLFSDDKPLNIITESELGDKKAELSIDIKKPAALSIMVLGKTQQIFVTPGDNIRLAIRREGKSTKFSFDGENAAHYFYKDSLEATIRSKAVTPKFDKEAGLDAFQEVTWQWSKSKFDFLTDFATSNKVSSDFLSYASRDIEDEYVRTLFTPLNYGSAEIREVPNGYFDRTDSLFVKNKFNIDYLTPNSLLPFTYRYVLYKVESEGFDSMLQSINQTFRGQTRSYMLANLIGVYAKKQSDDYREALNNLIQRAPNYIQDTATLQYVQRRSIEYNKLNRQIPEEVLTKTFLRSFDGDTKISLKDLLARYEGSYLYIDFWASWCLPCREDISTSLPSKEFLAGKEVKVIYISLDKQKAESSWKKAATDDGITKDQYLLADDFNSELARYLIVSSIPRYAILDKNHAVKSIDAPRIGLPHLVSLKAAIMNLIASDSMR